MKNKKIINMLILNGVKCDRLVYDSLCKSDIEIEKVVKLFIRDNDLNILKEMLLICYLIIFKLENKNEQLDLIEEVYRVLKINKECGLNYKLMVHHLWMMFDRVDVKGLQDFERVLRNAKLHSIYNKYKDMKIRVKDRVYFIEPIFNKTFNLYDENMALVEKEVMALLVYKDEIKIWKNINLRKKLNSEKYDIVWVIL